VSRVKGDSPFWLGVGFWVRGSACEENKKERCFRFNRIEDQGTGGVNGQDESTVVKGHAHPQACGCKNGGGDSQPQRENLE